MNVPLFKKRNLDETQSSAKLEKVGERRDSLYKSFL